MVTSLACLYQALLSRHRGRGVKEVRERKVENDAKMGGRLRVRSCAEVQRFEACSDMQGGGEGMGRGSRGLTRILLAVWSQWPDTSKFDSKKRGQRKQVRPKAKRDSVNCRHCSVNCRPKREFEHTHTHSLSLSLSLTHTHTHTRIHAYTHTPATMPASKAGDASARVLQRRVMFLYPCCPPRSPFLLRSRA